MIKNPSATKTMIICDKCRIEVHFAAGLTEDEANAEIQRHGWKITKPAALWRHVCPLCSQGKWGTH